MSFNFSDRQNRDRVATSSIARHRRRRDLQVREINPQKMRLAPCDVRVKLRHNCKHSRRKSRAAFRFWETDDNNRVELGNLTEIGEQFDLIMVRAQNVSFEGSNHPLSWPFQDRYPLFRDLTR